MFLSFCIQTGIRELSLSWKPRDPIIAQISNSLFYHILVSFLRISADLSFQIWRFQRRRMQIIIPNQNGWKISDLPLSSTPLLNPPLPFTSNLYLILPFHRLQAHLNPLIAEDLRPLHLHLGPHPPSHPLLNHIHSWSPAIFLTFGLQEAAGISVGFQYLNGGSLMLSFKFVGWARIKNAQGKKEITCHEAICGGIFNAICELQHLQEPI